MIQDEEWTLALVAESGRSYYLFDQAPCLRYLGTHN